MNTSNSNKPGRGHSVGSKCMVSCPADPRAELRVAMARNIDPSYGGGRSLNTILYGDNGRIVRLKSVVLDVCPICGEKGEYYPDDPVLWHVEPVDGKGKFTSFAGIHGNDTAIFFQYQLLPLGDEDLEIDIAAEAVTGEGFTDRHVATVEEIKHEAKKSAKT